jgi:hypothetical protein
LPIPIAVVTVGVPLCKLIARRILRFATGLHLVELITRPGIKVTASIGGKYWHRERHAANDYGSSECRLPKHHDLLLNTIRSIDLSP